MGDYYYGKILIGGIATTKQLTHLAELLGRNPPHASSVTITIKQMFDPCDLAGNTCLEHEDDETRDGEFAEAETYCQRIGLPYDRFSSQYGEFSPTRVYFDGTDHHYADCSVDSGEIYIELPIVQKAHREGTLDALLTKFVHFDNKTPSLFCCDTPRAVMHAAGLLRTWADTQAVPHIARNVLRAMAPAFIAP